MDEDLQNTLDALDVDDPNWLERILAEIEEEANRKKLKKDNPYVRDLVRVLWPHRNGFSRTRAIDLIRSLRESAGLPMPKKFDEVVQSAFNQHNEESAVFRKSGLPIEEAIFFPVGGKGSGRWAVNRERAFAWLKKKSLPDV